MSATILRDFAFRLGFQVDDRDLGRLERGLKNVRQQWAGVTAAARRTAMEIGAAGLLGGAALVKITRDTALLGDQTAKTAQQLGLGVEELQELSFAAERSGADLAALRAGIRNLARQSEGSGLTTVEIFERAANQISATESSVERLRIAQEMLGKSGSDLIPLLAGGAEGIRELRQAAREMGGILDEEATRAAEDFQDRMLDLGRVASGLRNEIGRVLIPVVNDLTSGFLRWYRANQQVIRQRLEAFAERIGAGLRAVGETLRRVDSIVRRRLGGWERAFAGAAGAAGGLYALIVGARFAGPLLGLAKALAVAAGAALGLSAGLGGIVAAVVAVALAIQAAGLGALVLIFDDLNALLRDGDSVIGRWIDSFRDGSTEGEAFADMLFSIATFIGQLNANIASLGTAVKEVFVTGFSGAAAAIGDAATALDRLLRIGLRLAGLELSDVFGAVASFFGSQAERQRGVGQRFDASAAAMRGLREQGQRQRESRIAQTNNASVSVSVDARGRDAPGAVGAEVGFSVDRALRGALSGVTP